MSKAEQRNKNLSCYEQQNLMPDVFFSVHVVYAYFSLKIIKTIQKFIYSEFKLSTSTTK